MGSMPKEERGDKCLSSKNKEQKGCNHVHPDTNKEPTSLYHMSRERQRSCEKRREHKMTSSINLGTPISTSRKNRNKSMLKQERINKYLSLKKEEQKAVTSRNMMVQNNGKNSPSRKKNLRVGEA